MGRATRWLRSLLGGGKKDQKENSSDRKEKKRWSFGKSSGRNSVDGRQIPAAVTPVADTWLRSYRETYYSETEKEQNKHAIAVAAATAAAADAAVAAAQAAVAVVRLTSNGRGTLFGGRERWAAIKIQTVFRGYLAKKALRALKGLVKLQALVRGYLVRRQAAATLHSMHALIRAQATVRTQKARSFHRKDHRFQHEIRPRKSIEIFDDTRIENKASFHSRRLSTSLESAINAFDESPKIVEIDTYRPKSRSRRRTNSVSDSGEEISVASQNLCPSIPCQIPARLSVPDGWNLQDLDWRLTGEECRFSTAQSTPRFANSGGSTVGIPVTPAKSVCTESFFRRYSNFPNYMANTQSFRAKVRSQSAPKQRPEPVPRKLSLNEMLESRASLSGVRMQRSCSQVHEAFNFKNAIVNKIDRSQELVREADKDYLHRPW